MLVHGTGVTGAAAAHRDTLPPPTHRLDGVPLAEDGQVLC